MTMHEALNFVKALHDHVSSAVENRGHWCWPTRELLAENVKVNRALFAGRNQSEDFRRQLGIAKRKGWAVEEGCSPHCHGRHVRLTGVGLEALRRLDESSCGCVVATFAEHRPCVTSGFRLRRKAA